MKKIIILLLLILFQGFFICSSIADNMSWQDYNELGDKMHKAGWYKDAVDYYNKAIGIKPNESIIYFNRGVSKYSLKDYKGAIADFEYTIYLNPNDNVAKSFLSMAKEGAEKNSLHLQNNSSKQKAKSFKTVKSPIKYTYPKYNIIQPIKPIKKLSYEDYYNSGIKKLDEKKYQEAILDFTNSIKLNTHKYSQTYANSYALRSFAYAKQKQYDNSINDINDAIRIMPKHAYFYFYRGRIKDKINDYNGAIEDFSYAIELEPKNNTYYIYRGNAKKSLKLYFSALDDYNASINIKESDIAIEQKNNLKANFKKTKFLITEYKSILEELNCIKLILFIFMFVIVISAYKYKKAIYNKISFKEYSHNEIIETFNSVFSQITINTPKPEPCNFGIDKDRIEQLDKICSMKQRPELLYSESDFQGILLIIVSFYFTSIFHNILIAYFNVIDDGHLLSFGLTLLICYLLFNVITKSSHNAISFKTLIKSINISDVEYKNYLLYKGILEEYEKRIQLVKETEAKKQQKIREEEERKLRQQRSYWEKYWAEKQKDGFKFEEAVGELYKKLKYKVTVTQGTGDGGVDLILKKDGETTIVQCKAHTHQVGPEPVRALWGVREDFNATKAIFVAYSGVTSGAWDFAKGKGLQIIDVNNLIQLSMQVHSDKG